MANVKFISVNVRGIGSQQKRRDVMHFLKNLKSDIILLQDTHLTKEKIPSFDLLWRGKLYHSWYTNNSRGTSILIHNSLHHEVINTFNSSNGNYVLLECKIGTDTYVIGSIYGPNRDEPHFYEHIGKILDEINYDHIILGGDFNFIMDAGKDCYGYSHENNVNAKMKFVNICNKHSLVDIWREQNPNKKRYTWFRQTPNQGARLDMFFISSHLSTLCSGMQINSG